MGRWRFCNFKRFNYEFSGDKTLIKGMPRNYDLYDTLDFLAEVTQHIPDKSEHQIRYYGWYSNKKRGQHLKKRPKLASVSDDGEQNTPFRRKCRMTWAALIRAIFEVDPLKCPSCGGNMRIVSFIEEEPIIEKILRHCNLWKEEPTRSPPQKIAAENTCTQPVYDYSFTEPA